MKKITKILATVFLTAAFTAPVFAGDGSGRLFEVKLNTPVTFTNNTIALVDFFVPELVLDLGDFADRMPDSGFMFSTETSPTVSVSATLPVGPSIGVDVGVSIYTKLGLSKEIFDFIGNGNKENLDITEKIDGYGDVFGYVQANLAWSTKKLKWSVSPALFTTMYHATSNGSYLRAYNTEEGDFGYEVNGIFDCYSVLPISDEIFTAEYWQNFSSYSGELWKALGFDISGTASYPITDMITVSGSARVPIVPSHLDEKTVFKVKASHETNVSEIASGTTEKAQFEKEFGETVAAKYSINRPLKLNVRGDIDLLAGLLDCYAGVGVGFEHPFSKIKAERGVYFDYVLGAQVSLMKMFTVGLQTEYTDQIFRNSLAASANLKFVEVDLGASLSSSTFTSSFRGDGLGAYVTLCFGL